MPRVRRHPQTGERGVSALVFALLLTVLLTVSAFAVDVGAAYTERRHDQNTADAAVMSGAVEAVLGGGMVDEIVDEVRQKADKTLGRTLSDADWEACQDGEQLYHTARELADANSDVSPMTDCISFSPTFEELRVKLPDQKAIGVFGPALGFGEIQISAAANAGIQSATGGLPFVALSTATKGDFVCLRTSSAKEPLPLIEGRGPGMDPYYPPITDADATPDPCHSTAFNTYAENFGTLKPWRYETCTQQNTDVEEAIAIGLDHPMGIFPKGYVPIPADEVGHDKWKDYEVRVDGDSSNDCSTAFPNTFQLDEGLNASGLSCSLIRNTNELCNGLTPRLQRGPYAVKQEHTLLSYDTFDNSAPWDFLRSADALAGDGAPPSCIAVAESRTSTALHGDDDYWDHYDRYDAFTQCLQEWGEPIPDDPEGESYAETRLFTKEIGDSARFGFVPQVAEDSLYNVKFVHIEGFLPIFMYRLYIQDDALTPHPHCDTNDTRESNELKFHDAGQEYEYGCGRKNKTIDRLASIILACGMVDDTLCNKSTGEPKYAGKDIYEFRLIK